jgi:hypothetical protein
LLSATTTKQQQQQQQQQQPFILINKEWNRRYAEDMSILPVTLWGLDPLLHVPLQLMIFQVKALVPVPDYEGKNYAKCTRAQYYAKA